MREPIFLELEQVKILHVRSLEAYGGISGYREPSLFESAVMQPRNIFYYTDGDLYDIAAGYAFHIAQAQACLDGNKRTGIAAALTFLALNGLPIDYDEDQLYQAMIDIAERTLDRSGLAQILRAAK